MKQVKSIALLLTLLVSVFLFNTGCNSNNRNNQDQNATVETDASGEDSLENRNQGDDLEAKTDKPEWGSDMDNKMWVVIEKLQSYGAPAIETLTPAEARQQPTPTTAVMDLMRENNIEMPPMMVDTMGKDIPVKGGMVHARIYTPKMNNDNNNNANNMGALPVIVYYHGGGWVIADLDTYDASARGLAEQAEAIVVSVHYRQAPENKFPTAHNDAFAAYQWVLKNAASMNGDPKRVAVAGESAGGNLAANVSIMARDKKVMMPVYQVLVYPVASKDLNAESVIKYANAKPLNKPILEWFMKHYLPNMAAASDPRIDLVSANLKGLPPTTIITAEIDPLRDGGKMLSDKMKDAGVEVDYKEYNGVTHEFFGMATIVPNAKDAQALAGKDLRKAFDKKMSSIEK